MEHSDLFLDEYIEKGNFFRSCLDSGLIDDFGMCRICGVTAGHGHCVACLQIQCNDWGCQEQIDQL